MASAAEQLAANLNFGLFSKATDLKRRIWFTLGALIVYRIGTFIPLPGIDPATLQQIFEERGGGVIDLFNTFSGGALERMSIFALNIMPYITASIIVQLMTSISPTLEALKKEGEAGRKKINQYTRYLTVLITVLQAFGIASGLQATTTEGGASAVIDPGPFFLFTSVVTLTGGTLFLMWLGEQVTQRGIGNGISLIIFAGIVATMPGVLIGVFEQGRTGALPPLLIVAIPIIAVALLALVVYFERAQRRLIIQYPKRQVGNRMYGGENSHLPLKLNTSGVIPPIFASSILLLPTTVASFAAGPDAPGWVTTIAALLGPHQPLFLALYAAFIIFFAFFYTAIVFNPADTADNLKKYGGFIPGIRPGKNTAEYLDYVLTRLTVVGAAYLTFVCLIPEFLSRGAGVAFYLGGTSLLIVVTVTMDTVTQIQSHLLAHQYEGLIRKARLRGKKG